MQLKLNVVEKVRGGVQLSLGWEVHNKHASL